MMGYEEDAIARRARIEALLALNEDPFVQSLTSPLNRGVRPEESMDELLGSRTSRKPQPVPKRPQRQMDIGQLRRAIGDQMPGGIVAGMAEDTLSIPQQRDYEPNTWGPAQPLYNGALPPTPDQPEESPLRQRVNEERAKLREFKRSVAPILPEISSEPLNAYEQDEYNLNTTPQHQAVLKGVEFNARQRDKLNQRNMAAINRLGQPDQIDHSARAQRARQLTQLPTASWREQRMFSSVGREQPVEEVDTETPQEKAARAMAAVIARRESGIQSDVSALPGANHDALAAKQKRDFAIKAFNRGAMSPDAVQGNIASGVLPQSMARNANATTSAVSQLLNTPGFRNLPQDKQAALYANAQEQDQRREASMVASGLAERQLSQAEKLKMAELEQLDRSQGLTREQQAEHNKISQSGQNEQTESEKRAAAAAERQAELLRGKLKADFVAGRVADPAFRSRYGSDDEATAAAMRLYDMTTMPVGAPPSGGPPTEKPKGSGEAAPSAAAGKLMAEEGSGEAAPSAAAGKLMAEVRAAQLSGTRMTPAMIADLFANYDLTPDDVRDLRRQLGTEGYSTEEIKDALWNSSAMRAVSWSPQSTSRGPEAFAGLFPRIANSMMSEDSKRRRKQIIERYNALRGE